MSENADFVHAVPGGLIDESQVVSTTLPLKESVQPTGDARVDAAMERMQDVENLPVEEQVQVFDEVHRRLQDALSDLQQ
jgi:hypothetical protein